MVKTADAVREKEPEFRGSDQNVQSGTKSRARTNSQNSKKRVQQKTAFIKPTDIVRIRGGIDRPFFILVLILTIFGLVMDFSASYAFSYSQTGSSYTYFLQQLLFAAIGFVGLFIAANFDYRWMRPLTIPVFIISLVFLVAVLAAGVARGDAQRWIYLGPISFQPSEFAKLTLVWVLARYVSINQDRITNYRNAKQSTFYGFFIPIMIMMIPCSLVVLEHHISGTMILFAIGMIVIFAAGANGKLIAIMAGAAGALGTAAILLSSYAKERVDMLIHPEAYPITGKIWQTMQGLYAVGSGGWFGVGLGNSRQKHLYVAEPQNDFVFSIVCEELGFIGAVFVILLFAILIWRGFVIALRAPDTFSSLMVIGLIGKVAIQSILNIAVVLNVFPNTGISLPFFSYGGSALVLQIAEMGIILSISRYSYRQNDQSIH